MVGSQPLPPLVDRARKEELILQKQVRQATSRILSNNQAFKQSQSNLRQSQSNLPTLIEASPDIHKKPLPFLPNLPVSVQLGQEQEQLQAWFDQYTDTDGLSVTTDDVPSLCSMTPTTQRNRWRDWGGDRTPVPRRERSASITFDLEEERRGRMEEEERRSELRRRNTKKERKGRRESPERVGRSRSMGSPLHKEQEEVALRMVEEGRRMLEEEQDSATMSMWCCRRCTLDNPLQESTCLACGGSRLSSIGDIVEPVMVPPTQARNLLKGEEQEQGVEQEQGQEARSWYCVVCTLENPALAYYCDACNTQSPLKTLKDLAAHTSQQDGSHTRKMAVRAARYFAIACFVAIIAMSVFNMVLGVFSALATLSSSLPGQPSPYTAPPPPQTAPPPSQSSPNAAPPGQSSPYTAPPGLSSGQSPYTAPPAPPSPWQPPPAPTTTSLPAPPPSPDEALALPALEELSLAPAPAPSQEELEDTPALLESLVTQSCLGIHPFLLLLLSPLFLLLLSQPPAPPAPRVPQPGARLNLLLNDPTLWRTEELPDKQTNWQALVLKAGFGLFTLSFWVGFVYYG